MLFIITHNYAIIFMKKLSPAIATIVIVALCGLSGLVFGVNYFVSCLISLISIVVLTAINMGVMWVNHKLEKLIKKDGK